jgi:(heptosyl)LPS beta-1,4-glucosyltransferase
VAAVDCAELTFVILTSQEGERLEKALASLPPESPIFILDAESTDETFAVAERFRARVERRPWTTFADARRHAIACVATPWFFMLDADEALTPELREALRALTPEHAGYRSRRLNRFCGRVMRGGAWGEEWVLRLARSDSARIEAQAAGGLHEHVAVDGEVGTLDGAIEHNSYPTLASYHRKFLRYTSIEARAKQATAADCARTFLRAVARALWQLTARRGYRDGWRGLFVAVASAAYAVRVSYLSWRRSR